MIPSESQITAIPGLDFAIGGSTYGYNTANIPTGTPGVMTTSPGERAWEHMLIHNDLVSAFQTDETGAITEGLKGATNAPSALKSTVSADKSKTGTASRAVSSPPKNATCTSSGSASRSTMSGIVENGVTYIDSGFTDTY